jgi:hypothetical protein
MEPPLTTADRRRGATRADQPAAGDGSGAARRLWASPPAGHVTVAELAGLGLAAAVGVVAVCSLATAHLGVHGLGTVLGSAAVLLVALALLARVRPALPPVAWDAAGLAPAGASGLLALVMFLPGFHYAVGDKDPGSYVMHAFAIARGGSVSFTDPLLAAGDLPVRISSPGARWPAIWITDAATGHITPQFYHLWPSLLATAYDLGGYPALVATTPLLGVLAVVLVVLIARRLAGPVAGWAAGSLLATNMMQVWQAKYPTTEILAQVLFLGALLGLLLAVQTGWRWAALVAGLLVGTSHLARPDGVLLTLLAVGGLATLWVLRRFDARAWWFAAGLAAVLPYALWQAYGPAGPYSRANGVPGLVEVLALIAFCAVGAAVLRPVLAPVVRRVDAALAGPVVQRRVGLVAVAGTLALFALGLARPLFGPDYVRYGTQGAIRSYDEINLYRLSWFFSWPGLLLLLAGVAVLALRRRTASGWLVLVLTVGLLTFYCWHARNSPYFMWVGRRFVPTVVPGMVVLIGVALAAVWTVRAHGRRVGVPLAVVLLAFLGAVQAHQSLPLRSHDEWAGSMAVNRSVAALSGDRRGIYLWAPAATCCTAAVTLFGPTVWLLEDEDSALLPRPPAQVGAYVRAYAQRFPDRPLFLVYETGARLPALPGLTATAAGRFDGAMPHWDESSISRPAGKSLVPYDFTAYQVSPATG